MSLFIIFPDGRCEMVLQTIVFMYVCVCECVSTQTEIFKV